MPPDYCPTNQRQFRKKEKRRGSVRVVQQGQALARPQLGQQVAPQAQAVLDSSSQHPGG